MKELKIYKGTTTNNIYLIIFNDKLKRQKIIKYNVDCKKIALHSIDIKKYILDVKKVEKYEFFFNKNFKNKLKEILEIFKKYDIKYDFDKIMLGDNVGLGNYTKIINEFNDLIKKETSIFYGDENGFL